VNGSQLRFAKYACMTEEEDDRLHGVRTNSFQLRVIM